VFYDLPTESMRCSWVVLLNADGADGVFLDENEDAERYMMRVASMTEAKALVNNRKNPVYPPIAIAAQVSGEVVTEAIVGKSGDVQKIIVVSGPPMLTSAAFQAAKSWSFRPMMVGTTAVSCEIKLVFRFRTFPFVNAWGDFAP
jgi:TonB family protein